MSIFICKKIFVLYVAFLRSVRQFLFTFYIINPAAKKYNLLFAKLTLSLKKCPIELKKDNSTVSRIGFSVDIYAVLCYIIACRIEKIYRHGDFSRFRRRRKQCRP